MPTKQQLTKPNDLGLVAEAPQFDDAAAAAGYEGMQADSFATPFLKLLQKGSPEVDEGSGERYVEGAKPGDFVNSVTGELFTPPLTIVVCWYARRYIFWNPRETGGGIKASLSAEELKSAAEMGTVQKAQGRWVDEDGVAARPTDEYYVIVNGQDRAVLALASTQLRKSTRLNQALTEHNGGPIWARAYTLTAVNEKNDKGSWKGVEFEPAGWLPVGGDLWNDCVAFYEQVSNV